MTHGDERISVVTNPLSGDVWEEGLSKREYFAAIAMQGLVSNSSEQFCSATYDKLASDALKAADALINALNEEK